MQYINGLHFKNLRGDIYGGLTAAVVALPLALAMGVASGAGPIAGIYGAIFVGFFAAILGGTPAQVSGPTGPMTVVMALIFTEYTAMFPASPEVGAALAFTIVIMGGIFQIVFGVLKVGKYIELVPHPVISGFMSGIGVIIILIQIAPLFGHDMSARSMDAVRSMPEVFMQPHDAALLLGVLSLIVVYGVPRYLPGLNRLMPSPLLALIIGTVCYMLFMSASGAPVLGTIPTGLPDPIMPVASLDLLPGMISSALILAALGSIDSLLTSLVADNVTKTYHKSDRELIGQGIGNALSGLFGGLPGAGATMRTVVNVKAGGQTPIAGALHAVVLLIIVLGAGGLASEIPNAVLAGILVKVGTDIIDWEYLGRLRHVPKAGVILMLVVLFMTVFVDLIMAVATGMIMASLIFLQRVTDMQLASMEIASSASEELDMTAEEAKILADAEQRIVMFHIGGPVSFGAAKGMIKMVSVFDQYDVLVIDLTEVPVLDYSASRALDTIISDAIGQGREVMLVGVRSSLGKILKKQNILNRVHSDYMFVKRIGALREALSFVDKKRTDLMPVSAID
ncbi:MAG: SulP family inorganic anion transporter [Gammaproteobacteria bacterium]|nr:SulP family inorganic anion transporter [Gammaproteobacteria bacterium]